MLQVIQSMGIFIQIVISVFSNHLSFSLSAYKMATAPLGYTNPLGITGVYGLTPLSTASVVLIQAFTFTALL